MESPMVVLVVVLFIGLAGPSKGKVMKIIEIRALEYFDKTFGNSYFSAQVYIDDRHVADIPSQYGYGDQYRQESIQELEKQGLLTPEELEAVYQHDRSKVKIFASKKTVKRMKDLD